MAGCPAAAGAAPQPGEPRNAFRVCVCAHEGKNQDNFSSRKALLGPSLALCPLRLRTGSPSPGGKMPLILPML